MINNESVIHTGIENMRELRSLCTSVSIESDPNDPRVARQVFKEKRTGVKFTLSVLRGASGVEMFYRFPYTPEEIQLSVIDE